MAYSKWLLTGFLAATLSACVVVPRHQAMVVAPVGEAPLADVEVAPPAPVAEVIPAVPFAGAVWIGGYWGWRGGRHVWVGGHYEAGRVGYHWEPHRWVAVGGRWHLRAGFWAKG